VDGVRVHPDAKVKTAVSSSGVLYGIGTDEARDVPTALHLIALKRQANT
jgi:hypothetical protein